MSRLKHALDQLGAAIHTTMHNTFEFAVMAKDMQTPMEKTTALTTQAGAAIAIFGGFTLNEWAAIVGITIGILSFGVNCYVSFRRLKLDEEVAKRRKK